MTRNIFIALYATLAVVLIMGTVTGIVIGMGWKQGIIESIIVSCGIGMACDFVAHLGFAYRQANRQGKADTRGGLVGVAIERMAPALTAAAFSTGVMGLLMYNCELRNCHNRPRPPATCPPATRPWPPATAASTLL